MQLTCVCLVFIAAEEASPSSLSPTPPSAPSPVASPRPNTLNLNNGVVNGNGKTSSPKNENAPAVNNNKVEDLYDIPTGKSLLFESTNVSWVIWDCINLLFLKELLRKIYHLGFCTESRQLTSIIEKTPMSFRLTWEKLYELWSTTTRKNKWA